MCPGGISGHEPNYFKWSRVHPKTDEKRILVLIHLHTSTHNTAIQIQPYVAYCDQYRPVFKMHLSTQRKTDEDNDNELTEGEWVLNLKKKKKVEWLV